VILRREVLTTAAAAAAASAASSALAHAGPQQPGHIPAAPASARAEMDERAVGPGGPLRSAPILPTGTLGAGAVPSSTAGPRGSAADSTRLPIDGRAVMMVHEGGTRDETASGQRHRPTFQQDSCHAG
jgi:hypothetical protein